MGVLLHQSRKRAMNRQDVFSKTHAHDACASFEAEPVMVNVQCFIARLRDGVLRENRRRVLSRLFPVLYL
jgi:hypothetical protein